MAGVTVSGFGLRFVQECMRQYWGNCFFPAFFIAGIIWSFLRHRKQEGAVFLGYAVFLALTVYNPIVVKYVIPKLGFELEYYRFIWLLPVIPGVAYYAVKLIWSLKKNSWRAAAFVLAAVVLMAAGEAKDGVVNGFSGIENVYKVPNDLIEICEYIHGDCEGENPRVVFEMGLNTVARQYDASLHLVLNRDAVLYRAGSTSVSVNTESASYQRQKVIMDAIYYNEAIEDEQLADALNQTGTEYIAVELESECQDQLKRIGAEEIARTEEFVVYRYSAVE